ncbi:transmembrane protein 79 [Scyliorhinus canicula]|uniref:transmembrane protein 79 n=1 Tax=Scyliorhinus canicula TaxID=7830 RepID=UPI0018F2CA5D|nr:transmembrane protein 79 [Scyliorhinus canicula]
MSGFLPTAPAESPSPDNRADLTEKVLEQRDDSDCPGSSGTSEGSDLCLLHSSDTLEYPNSGPPALTELVDLEMVTLGGDRPASQPGDVLSEPQRSEECRATDDLWPEKDGPLTGTVPVVFDPAVRVVDAPTEAGEEFWPEPGKGPGVEDPAGQPFLTAPSGHGSWSAARGYPPHDAEWPESEGDARAPKRRSCARCTRPNLKATAALVGSLLIYPCFLYGAYVFLPFDVPLMPDLSTRMIYTLRCGAFTTVPIVMGIIVYGLARCCSDAIDPFGPRRDEVEIHLRFVTDSIHLLVLFLVNLLVLSTYIPQEVLKLLPLLAASFALARLIYWLTFAISSTFRGFGYGLSFFPIVALLIANLCYMFILAPDKMFATSASGSDWQEKASGARQRFWG